MRITEAYSRAKWSESLSPIWRMFNPGFGSLLESYMKTADKEARDWAWRWGQRR